MINTILRYSLGTFFLVLGNLFAYPFSKKARHQLSATYAVLTYPFSPEQVIPLSRILNDETLQINIAPLKANEHNVSEFELLSICAILKDIKAQKVFEIGTYDGRTTRAMMMNLQSGGHILTLNLPPDITEVSLPTSSVDVHLSKKVISGERFLGTPEEEYITQLWGDSAKFDFTPFYKQMDVVFIDGAHSEEYVTNDTKHAMKLIKEDGGIIIWHDAHLFGVKDFFITWLKNNRFPVYFIKDTSLAVMSVKSGIPHNILS